MSVIFCLNPQNYIIKGTVSVILSEPSCKHGKTNLQRYPRKLSLIKYEKDINVFCSFTMFILICEMSAKVACTFLLYE